MKHGTGDGAREAAVRERHGRGVSFNRGHVANGEPCGQRIGEGRINLDRGEPIDAQPQQIRGQAGTRSDLQGVGPEVDSFEDPWHHIMLKYSLPPRRPAQQTMNPVHTRHRLNRYRIAALSRDRRSYDSRYVPNSLLDRPSEIRGCAPTWRSSSHTASAPPDAPDRHVRVQAGFRRAGERTARWAPGDRGEAGLWCNRTRSAPAHVWRSRAAPSDR